MRLAGIEIELWVEERDGRPAVNGTMERVLAELLRAGGAVRARVLERDVIAGARDPKAPRLVLLKSATNLALSTALAAARDGVVFLNPAPQTVRAHDKAAATAALAAAGVPVPATYLLDGATGGDGSVGLERSAWFTKPVRGIHGAGVVRSADLPAAVAAARTPLRPGAVLDDGARLVQRSVGSDPFDVKVYVAGESVYAARKEFDARSFASDRIAPVQLSADQDEIVRAAGDALGLTLYGLDLRVGDDGAVVVVDANPFPGYRGFPQAAQAIVGEAVRALAAA